MKKARLPKGLVIPAAVLEVASGSSHSGRWRITRPENGETLFTGGLVPTGRGAPVWKTVAVWQPGTKLADIVRSLPETLKAFGLEL